MHSESVAFTEPGWNGCCMYFRFCSALVLVVIISLAGAATEKRQLELRRLLSHQHYQLEVLVERQAALRVEAQRLGAPLRLLETLDQAQKAAVEARPAAAPKPKSKAKTKRR